jgi:L-threonylcarbamoyladenylate synthase
MRKTRPPWRAHEAKGRPHDHPVIVHAPGADLDYWVTDVPAKLVQPSGLAR